MTIVQRTQALAYTLQRQQAAARDVLRYPTAPHPSLQPSYRAVGCLTPLCNACYNTMTTQSNFQEP